MLIILDLASAVGQL
jgi:hypothetical protein